MTYDDRLYRQPPRSLEAEQALLGAILINNEAHDRVSGFLEPRHFFDQLHGAIYEAAAKLIAAGKVANPITLRTFFEGAEPVGNIPVPVYLGQLAANATTIINAKDYARTVYDLAIRRGLIEIGETMVNAAYDSPVDFPPKEQIEEVEGRLYALAEGGDQGGGAVPASQIYADVVADIDRAYKNPNTPIGIPTGIVDLDRKLGGLRDGNLIVIAGRPSMGKTALATSIIYRRSDTPIHFFSLEMTRKEIALRLLSAETGIAADRLLRGDVDEDAWRPILEARQSLEQSPLLIDETGSISIAQLVTRARREKRQRKTKLIVVDYLQLMRGTRKDNRTAEVSEITVGLKALAKELDVPVIALSQLSRSVENRQDRRPQLADLRESGSIEQDADVVIFVFREDYYGERAKPTDEDTTEYRDWVMKMAACAGKAELIIGKNRPGQIGVVKAQWDGPTMLFSDLAYSNQTYQP